MAYLDYLHFDITCRFVNFEFCGSSKFCAAVTLRREWIKCLNKLIGLFQLGSGGWFNERESGEDVSTNTIAALRTELAEKDKSIAQFKNELEKSIKQQSHTASLMNTLQKENSSKETLLQHAKTDIEKLKKTLREKEAIFASVSAKVSLSQSF